MELSKTFIDLVFWQKAHQFTLGVYRITKGFPREELYGLTSQFRRAAVSVASNIAEGYARKGKRDKLRFFNVALSSLQECKYYLILTKDLQFGDFTDLMELADVIGRMLNAYSRTIRSKLAPNS